MQFRSPFEKPSSEQPWQQQYYLPQYQPPPVMQPQPPKKKSHKRLWFIISAFVVVFALAFAIGLHDTNISTQESLKATEAPTQISPHTQQSTSQSTSVDTTTKSAVANNQNTSPTHGTPTIAGHISDFFGTYGTPLMTNGKDTVWLLSSGGDLSLDARDTGSGFVGYLAVSAPPNWSKQKVQAFCLGFAPQNYTLDKTSLPNNTSDLSLYNYDSPTGKFALHVSSGAPNYCYMNALV